MAADEHPRTLTLNDAALLGELIIGVQRNLKMRYYPRGSESADKPLVVTLRAFTRNGGGFIHSDAEVRDAFVWASGLTEQWFHVDHLIKAIDNLDGKHGFEEPIAVIDSDNVTGLHEQKRMTRREVTEIVDRVYGDTGNVTLGSTPGCGPVKLQIGFINNIVQHDGIIITDAPRMPSPGAIRLQVKARRPKTVTRVDACPAGYGGLFIR